MRAVELAFVARPVDTTVDELTGRAYHEIDLFSAPRAWWPDPTKRGQGLRAGMFVDATCPCGAWILFGSLATDEERAAPRCSACLPFAPAAPSAPAMVAA